MKRKIEIEGLKILAVNESNEQIIIKAVSANDRPKCPFCNTVQTSPHSRHKRLIQDLPIDGKTTYIEIDNRMNKCKNPDCEHNTYTENFDFVDNNSKSTKRFVDYVYNYGTKMSARKAEKKLKAQG